MPAVGSEWLLVKEEVGGSSQILQRSKLLCISNLVGARAGCLGITVDKNPFIDETDCKRAWIGCDFMK